MIMNNWFAPVYRVKTNRRKRIVSRTNQRQLRAFFRALESGYLFLFCFALYSFVKIGEVRLRW